MKKKKRNEDHKRKKKRLLREQVYTSIKGAIIGGAFEPGRRLIEEKLAEDMKTGRTPVREAMQKLEKEGLIYRLPKTGLAVKGVTEDEVDEVFGIRGILEGYAGFLATERIEEDELTSLEEIIAREEACLENMNPEEFIRLDGELHDVLYKAAKDTRLYNLLNDLRDKKQEPETGCKARKKAYDEGQGHYQEEDQAGSGAEDMILKAQIAQIPIRGYRRLLSVRASEW